MIRPLRYPLAIALALTTAGILLALATALPGAPGAEANPTADAGVVRRFYTALNAAIAAGDATRLDAAVWPDLAVERTAGDPWELSAFRRHLLALHAARTGLSFRLAEVAAHDHSVVALVAPEGAGRGGWVGVPGTVSASGLAADRLRVAAGRVVAYTGIATELSPPEGILAGVLEMPAPTFGPFGWGLARVRLAPGAALPFFAVGAPVLYAVEEGELALKWDGGAHIRRTAVNGSLLPPREVRGRDREWALGAGDQVLIEAGASYVARSGGSDGATALAAAILPHFGAAPTGGGGPVASVAPDPSSWSSWPGLAAATPRVGISGPMGAPSPGEAQSEAMFRPPTSESGIGWVWPDGVTVTPLAVEPIATEALSSTGRLRVAVDRLTLAPGHHAGATPAGPIVLAVESGRGIVSASKVTAVASADGGVWTVEAGKAVSRATGERLTVHNLDAAPLVVLLLTLTPVVAPDRAGTPAAEGTVASP